MVNLLTESDFKENTKIMSHRLTRCASFSPSAFEASSWTASSLLAHPRLVLKVKFLPFQSKSARRGMAMTCKG